MTSLGTEQHAWVDALPLLRCVDCGGGLEERDEQSLHCPHSGRIFPIHDGVLDVLGDLEGNNKVAADFYDGPLWPKFRFWEHFTFFLNGGARRARSQVMKHLGELSGTR